MEARKIILAEYIKLAIDDKVLANNTSMVAIATLVLKDCEAFANVITKERK